MTYITIRFARKDILGETIKTLNEFWIVISRDLRKQIEKDLKDSWISTLYIDFDSGEKKIDNSLDYMYSDEGILRWKNKYYYVYRPWWSWPRKKHLFIETAIKEAMRLSKLEKCEFEVLQKVWETKMSFNFVNHY